MLFYLLLAISRTVAALPALPDSLVREVFQFQGNLSWIENLAVRSNGNVLTTRMDIPDLFEISPLVPNPKATLVHSFNSTPGVTGITGLNGITELVGHFDVFAVIAGEVNHALFLVDFRQTPPDITLVAQNLPQAVHPNGIASLDAAEHAVLISDSSLGNVWHLDLDTGAYTLAIDDPNMRVLNASAARPLGVNGIRILGNNLYFINSGGPFLARIPIHANGTAAGASEIIGFSLESTWTFDDFAIDESGTAYIATGPGNAVTRITPDGEATIIAGNVNSLEIASPTSVQFGRTLLDQRTLYVSTNGGQETLGNGAGIGAQLVSVKLL